MQHAAFQIWLSNIWSDKCVKSGTIGIKNSQNLSLLRYISYVLLYLLNPGSVTISTGLMSSTCTWRGWSLSVSCSCRISCCSSWSTEHCLRHKTWHQGNKPSSFCRPFSTASSTINTSQKNANKHYVTEFLQKSVVLDFLNWWPWLSQPSIRILLWRLKMLREIEAYCTFPPR